MNLPDPEAQKTTLSIKDRLRLIDTLNRLPLTEFRKLEFALDVPPGVMPSKDSPLGERSAALLEWVKSPGACGLQAMIIAMKEMGIELKRTDRNINELSDTCSLTVTLKGNFDEVDRPRVLQVVQQFQEIARDSSVDILPSRLKIAYTKDIAIRR